MINSNGILINRRIINMIIQASLFHVINCEIFWNIALFCCSMKLVDAMFFLCCQRLTCPLDLYRESKFLTVYFQYAQTSSYLHQILLTAWIKSNTISWILYWSTHNLFGLRLESSMIFWNALTRVIFFLSFIGTIQTYLL